MATKLLAAVITVLALLGHVMGQGGYGPSPSPSPSPSASGGGLAVGYYDSVCPNAEEIVRGVVKNAVAQDAGVGAGLIRLLFHDCFVQGCDGSVLLDATAANTQPEKLAPPNLTLRGFEVIDEAKAALEAACPGDVSCADVVAFAARDATVLLSGSGVDFAMPAGRLDGRVSLASEALGILPPPTSNLSALTASFAAKGLGVGDLVVLSGAHSVGRSHCSSFSDRLNSSSSSGSDINPALAASLTQQCSANASSGGGGDPTVMQDAVTPDVLDRQYYTNVLNGSALFTSDAALLTSLETKVAVLANAIIPGLWEGKFRAAMVRMAAVEVKSGAGGEIRKNCRVVS
ncbi:hypothetical protein EE612_040920 [Oryza sativa]|uniref:Peroxidase n=1 Tax=Oryza sativa subsp. indica TaxID=39946 RepID=A2YP51_ORYSI|nr:hypothetical protein OsI_27041 [Oryza sativa Indica Group]KAB8106542.1 hypothetical protein EE612_040920 [Oryza sativa]